MARDRGDLIEKYSHLNGPSHSLDTGRQEQRLELTLKDIAAGLGGAAGVHLATRGVPESIHRLRKEQDTARDLYSSGALSEALWQEVRPRSGEPSELPPSAVAWQEEYARQQEGG